MKRALRFLMLVFLSLLAGLGVFAALIGYYVYTPDPAPPQLSGTLRKENLKIDGLERSYRTYIPKNLPEGAPLVLVLHGSGESPQSIRKGTGFAFERLADAQGFAVVYPKAYASDWNDCSSIGDKFVNGAIADDATYLAAIADKLIAELGVDPTRVFATGVSNGGSMVMRLALEHPTRYRAVAAVVANVPAQENFQCKPSAKTSSIMIMNGTKDTLVPYAGGEVSLFGLFYKGGKIISSLASAQYFVDLNHLTAAPQVKQTPVAGDVLVEQSLWRNLDASGNKVEVELVTIRGGGHGLPQPYARRPRLLGPSPMAPDGAAMIWAFFERQRP